MKMPLHIYRQLKEWLEGRESDIALDIEDFGYLEGVFIWCVMRTPDTEAEG